MPARDDVRHDLQDRAAQPCAAGAAEHEARRALPQHDRRRHHRRQPLARLRRAHRGRARRACCSDGCPCRARRRRCPSRATRSATPHCRRASSTEMCVVPFSTCFASAAADRAHARTPHRAPPPAPPSHPRSRSGVGSAIAERPQAERDQHAAARRRRVRAELVAPVLDAHRLALDDPVLGQVFQRERSAAALHVLDDSLAPDRPRRELTRPPRRAARASRRAPGSRTARPSRYARPSTPYIASPSGEWRSSPSRIRCRYPCIGVSSKPSRASRSRRRHELRPRHPPPPAMRRLETQRRPRNRHRRRTRPEQLLRIAVEIDRQLQQLDRDRAACGTATKKSSTTVSPVARLVHEHEPAAARARQRALAHPGHERGRDARIHGRPARLQHPRARLRGQRMPGCDCAFHAAWRLRGHPVPHQPQVPLYV